MASAWSDKLQVGVRTIDAQHREYFKRTDQLLDLCLANATPREFIKIFDFLRAYIRYHFSHEEQLMEDHAYPDVEFHKSQHQWFARQVDDLASLAEEPDRGRGSLRLNSLLIDWFQHHIQSVDRKLAEFLIAASQRPASQA